MSVLYCNVPAYLVSILLIYIRYIHVPQLYATPIVR